MRDARKVCSSSFLLAAVIALQLLTACKQQPSGAKESAFSFDVYGDSRSMMYLPYQQDQEADARQLMVDMFELALPAKVAPEVVQKDVKLIYDPSNKELVQMVMPFMTASEITTLKFDKGWVTEASVEDIKLLPGVSRTMFRLDGGDWVAREAVKDIKSGNTDFLVNTGDLVWWGKQGGKPSDNPYWTLVDNDVLRQLPPPNRKMQEAGLDGRVFPAVGNHEVWDDSDVQGLLASFPYLKKMGVSDKKLIYTFDYSGVRFIFLWTGKYDYRDPTGWVATRPAYEAQMKQLQTWMEAAYQPSSLASAIGLTRTATRIPTLTVPPSCTPTM